MKNVLVLTGAGQIGLAIVRRIGSGMKIVVSDKNAANAASRFQYQNDKAEALSPRQF